ncbi:MAG: GntR family transcriptional regulator [Acidobacteria bacterium]|nr:GntR family transcriptional regulator [Acidobacteriota bacterium]
MCYHTHVIPFRVQFQPGLPLYEQVVYAAKKALLAGQLRAGDPFPSVRAMSTALKINPNTAHKVLQNLINDGLLEVRPGIGAVVAKRPVSTRAEKNELLQETLEQVVVEAKKLGLDLEEVQVALEDHWARLDGVKR